MEKKFFRSIVITGFIKSLTLSLTGLIDCAVVGQFMGADGLSAMKLAMPVFSILALFSFVLSSGLSVTISKELSVNGEAKANEVFKSVFTVICVVGVFVMAIGFTDPDILSDIFAGPDCDPAIGMQAADYLKPIFFGALAILLYDVLGTIAMLGGAAKYLKISSVAMFAADVAGDLLSVRLGLGLTGIAVASALAYAAALVCILMYFLSKGSIFRLGLCIPDRLVMRRVFLLGMPIGVTLICKILRPMAVNRIMLAFGTKPGLAALSIQDAIRYVPGALCTGIANAALILAGMFAAEADIPALRQEKRSIIRWSYIGGTALAAVLLLLSSPMLWIFTSDAAIHKLGVSSLMLYLPGVPFTAANAAIVSCLQGLGQRGKSSSYALYVNLILPVIFAWILGKRFGDLGVYASYTASEVLATASFVLVLLIKRSKNQTIVPVSLITGNIETEFRMDINDLDEAVAASEKMNEICLGNGFGKRQSYLIALTVEELTANSLTHGFNDKKKHYLELRALFTSEQLILRLRDDGRPFNLTERYRMINPDDPTKNIGLRIIFGCADEVTYNSSMNMNNVCIKINREDN